MDAHADPITPETDTIVGSFDWVDDTLFGGSTFDVNNGSLLDFDNVFVDLFAAGATTPFETLTLGDIASFGFAQSIDDLSGLAIPADLNHALLRLTLGDAPLTAALFAASLTGDGTVLATSTDIVQHSAVPEPGTLLLFATGLTALAFLRRRGHSSPSRH